ncbi:carbohydrate-binding family 9-like protein [Sphingobacterium mizutaii]|uniref:carbohydrate-binding family 9-like protein n=1 Tax=Sphingobacterium mizutaii TaxID=1010 RepID=UPI0028AEB5A8|nr:carbohydrate-binding family 9-like protein [Sphingobacterium mizutaii]
MKELEVKKIDLTGVELTYASLANSLFGLEWNQIDQAPWQTQFPINPEVKFQVAYDQESIYIHYDVHEEYIKAQYIRPNENIWEDSCVEFFISFDDRKTYYNLEFNVLGAGLIGYGTSDKANRNRLTSEEILSVSSFTQVKNLQGKKSWNIILAIPISLFGKTVDDLRGKTVQANFYKCGDNLPNPHFVAWNPIDVPNPNFHLPEFFGEIKFQ